MSRDGNGFDEWGGYMQAKILKLEEQFAAASDPFRQSNLFAGISIYVNGLTNPSADELKRIMMVHGGTFHHYERAHTTYIIASNLPDVKVRNMDTSRIISPQWVVDCLRDKRILDYTRYLLYTNQKTTQPKIAFTKAKKNEPSEKNLINAEELAAITSDLRRLNDRLRESLGASRAAPATVNPNIPQMIKPDVKPVTEKAHQADSKPAVIPDASASIAENAEEEEKIKLFVDESEVDECDTKCTTADKSETAKAERSDKSIDISSKAGPSKNMARTAASADFLDEFFNNSRLHHIATLGTGFKQYIADLREGHKSGDGFPARAILKEKLLAEGVPQLSQDEVNHWKDVIMHIDMDCFFVSVGLRKLPHLRGKPIAVTHSKGGSAATNVPVHPQSDRQAEKALAIQRLGWTSQDSKRAEKVQGGFEEKMSLSEIASCSYEARAKGVRNGMFVGHALQLCPDLQTIPYDFDGYKEVAYSLYNIVAKYTLEIEAVSCDEMFVNLAEVVRDVNVAPMDLVRALRTEVRDTTGCPCSAGVGANKLQARMATKRAKPDGQYDLLSTDLAAYMSDVPIEELPGVGHSNAYTLKRAYLRTCGDLQKMSLLQLQAHVGKKLGETLYQFCRGIDSRPLQLAKPRQSVSAEVNYGIRFNENEAVEKFLRQLSGVVHQRLLEAKRRCKCVTLKVMVRAKEAPVETSKFMGHGVCDTLSKAVSLSELTSDLEQITRTVLTIFKAMALPPHELRGIGIQLSKLNDPSDDKPKCSVLKNMFSKLIEMQKDRPPAEEGVHEAAASSKNTSPIKPKSPVKSRSPLKRSAARPPPKRPNVLGMLQQAAASSKRPATVHHDNLSVAPSGIDPGVFAELPASIRAEIIEAHGRQRPEEGQLPANTSNQMGDTPMPGSRLSSDNIFAQTNSSELLLAWVKSTDTPEGYDIELALAHACELIRTQQLSRLYTPLNYLARLTDRQANCHWHAAFKTILAGVQEEVQRQFEGRKLLANAMEIRCSKCK